MINYQGRLSVSGTNFTGAAHFKFALVDATGTTAYWSHDHTGLDGSEPTGPAVVLAVSNGVFSVNLGDAAVPNMTQPIPASVFTNQHVYLRVWADDGSHGSQRLTPDRRITAVGYALTAETVVGAVPAANLTGIIPSTIVESSLPTGLTVVSLSAQDPTLLAKGYQSVLAVPSPAWTSGAAADAPSARYGHTAVWTGSQMLVWGGRNGVGAAVLRSGGLYSPESDEWTLMSTVDPPEARSEHTAVWTATEMIIWGGRGANGVLNSGGRFDPVAQQWKPTSTAGAPTAREGHVAVWTGSRMLIWGGRDGSGLLSDGALYDPATDVWTSLHLPGPPEARLAATAVWAGDRVIIWGGEGDTGLLNSGSALIFVSDAPRQWTSTPMAKAPSPRRGHTAVWTGQRMIVWGGESSSSALGDGAMLDPSASLWTPLSAAGAPAPRFQHAALWTGQEFLQLFGSNGSGSLASSAAYNPATDHWRSLTGAGHPLARTWMAAVWTGSQALVFGGQADGPPVAALQSLVPQPPWYFYRKP